MKNDLLSEIRQFMAEAGLGEHRFGILAVNNGRLVERLEDGRRLWPETEARVRAFIASERARRGLSKERA